MSGSTRTQLMIRVRELERDLAQAHQLAKQLVNVLSRHPPDPLAGQAAAQRAQISRDPSVPK